MAKKSKYSRLSREQIEAKLEKNRKIAKMKKQ